MPVIEDAPLIKAKGRQAIQSHKRADTAGGLVLTDAATAHGTGWILFLQFAAFFGLTSSVARKSRALSCEVNMEKPKGRCTSTSWQACVAVSAQGFSDRNRKRRVRSSRFAAQLIAQKKK